MAAVGCMLPFALLVMGAAIGAAIGGTVWAYWGCAAGFVVGLVLMLAGLRWFERLRSR